MKDIAEMRQVLNEHTVATKERTKILRKHLELCRGSLSEEEFLRKERQIDQIEADISSLPETLYFTEEDVAKEAPEEGRNIDAIHWALVGKGMPEQTIVEQLSIRLMSLFQEKDLEEQPSLKEMAEFTLEIYFDMAREYL